MIKGLNHITFAVSDLNRSIRFYRDALGCGEVLVWANGAYLNAGGVWVCLSLDPNAHGNKDYTHVAFSVDEADFAALSARVKGSGAIIWKDNMSEGSSLYFCDPDGHRLEIHVGTLASRLDAVDGNRCGASQS